MRLCLILLFSYALCSYIPELAVSASAEFLNKEISANYAVNISRKINSAKINDTEFDQAVSGIRVHGKIANISQNVTINWKANFLNATGPHTFLIHSNNINVTITADLNITVGATPKQSGPLVITITKMTVNTTLDFKASPCGGSGLGFDVQISAISGNSDTFEMKIQGKGKGLDNRIIQVLEKIIRPKVPKILTDLALNQINPFITNITCQSVYDTFALGNQTYYVTGNTTQVPEFMGNDLFLPLDIILTNIRSNSTNDEIANDYLPQMQLSPGVDALFTASSNMINTLIWLIEDSFVLHKVITNDMLGPSPPIVLNTTNLTILMPKLKQWPNKAMLLIVSPASRVSQIFIRGGRLMGALSMSVRFIVNNTGNIPDVYTCLSKGACIQACDLNVTLSLSLAPVLQKNTVKGLLHSLSIASIKVIQTAIELNVKTLNSILSSIVSSSIPSVNDQLRIGVPLNITNLTKSYGLTSISSRFSLDYMLAELQFKV